MPDVGTDYGAPRWFWFLLVAVIVLALAAMLGPAGWRYYRARQLLATGVEAVARVISIEDTGNRFNRNPEVRLKLEVRPDAGAPFEAATTAVVSMVDLRRYDPGAMVTVRFDPADRRVVLVGPAPGDGSQR